MTYTDLQNAFLRDIGLPGSTDAQTLNHFNLYVNERYQLVLAQLQNWTTQKQQTASTVASQQFYHYPPGVVNIETATVTLGSIAYPLLTVDSQLNWDRLNQVLISTSAIPQFIFPRRDDFGIWPIPQGVYTITFNYDLRDRNLTNADVTTGTVTVTNNSTTVTNSGSNFTTSMAGRWFAATTDGYWYRISSATTTTLTLEEAFQGTTASSLAYKVGESPELPEEAHPLLSIGCTADWFAGPRSDLQKATWWNNVFWTGDGNNNDRTGRNVRGGLIGLEKRYAERSNSKIVRHQPSRMLRNSKIWATTLSS